MGWHSRPIGLCATLWPALLFACGAATPLDTPPHPPAVPAPALTLLADVDGDGAPDTIDLYRSRDGERAVLAWRRPDGAAAVSRLYPLWDLQRADLDGDGRDSLLVGAWTRVRRHEEPEPHRTVWVVEWRGRFVDVWRGSGLARPLRDFRVVDLDADGVDELLALEETADGCSATAYGWTGFGFAGLARLPLACTQAHFCAAAAAAALCPTDGSGERRVAVRAGRLRFEDLAEAGESAALEEAE